MLSPTDHHHRPGTDGRHGTMAHRFPASLRRILNLSLAALLLVLFSSAASDSIKLPELGSQAGALITPAGERRLGQAFMKSVYKALPVVDDLVMTDYINQLGNQLVAASDDAGGQYHFFIIEEPVINAFAGPGGYIGVYSGLILAAETEGELAAVMAHEVAHISQNHLLRAFDANKRASIPATALLIAAAILGAQVSADVGLAAVAGIQGAMAQRQINFTRENEKEADRIGIETLAAAGHDPYAMPGFFQRLTKASRVTETGAPEFLRTHPVTTNRVADAVARAERYSYRQRPDSLRFHLTRANLRQHAIRRPQAAVDRFETTLSKGRYRNETAERYGYALALVRAGQLRAAENEAAVLLQQHPSELELIVLSAKIDALRGRTDKAVAALKSATGLHPMSWPLRYAYAQALIAAKRPQEALRSLKDLQRVSPAPRPVYALMTDAAHHAGDKAGVHRWRAERLYLEGDIEPAIRQLELALRTPSLQFQRASRIQVRLAALRQEEREFDGWQRRK